MAGPTEGYSQDPSHNPAQATHLCGVDTPPKSDGVNIALVFRDVTIPFEFISPRTDGHIHNKKSYFHRGKTQCRTDIDVDAQSTMWTILVLWV